MNACQYGKIKLNNDSIDDLVIFDRSSGILSTYLAENKKYIHHPEYQNFFPPISNWILLKDFNHDGKSDIFTHTSAGIKVYQNISKNGIPDFQLIKNPLLSQGFSGMLNIQISGTDLPSIEDIDNDGDLDLICFNFYNGSQIEYHFNTSKELYGHDDSLTFIRKDDCWGGVEEISCGKFNFGLSCETGLRKSNSQARIQHLAASTLLAIDLDGDGDKDLFETKESCNNIGQLINVGNKNNTRFTKVDTIYPDGIRRNSFPISSSQFYEDIDFDNIKDLIISSNAPLNTTNKGDFSANSLLYKNIGTNAKPVFSFIQNAVIQNSMIDVGENASPAFFDFDADNDLDLIVGNRGEYDSTSSTFRSSLYLLQNVGSVEKPIFKLFSKDYLSLSTLNFTSIKPYFTDLNNDNALDVVFSCVNNGNKELKYILNSNSINSIPTFEINNINTIADFTVSNTDNFCFADLNNDFWQDVLIGKAAGNIEYWTRNSSGISYNLVTSNFGGLTNSNFRTCPSLAVVDFDKNESNDLLITDNSGYIYLYKNISQIIQNNTLTIEDTIKINPNDFTENHFSKTGSLPTLTIADIDKNGIKEYYIGNAAGGILSFSETKSGNLTAENDINFLKIYPNPNHSNTFTFESKESSNCTIYDVTGKVIVDSLTIPSFSKLEYSFPQLSSGVYLVKIKSSVNYKVMRLVVL